MFATPVLNTIFMSTEPVLPSNLMVPDVWENEMLTFGFSGSLVCVETYVPCFGSVSRKNHEVVFRPERTPVIGSSLMVS